MINNLIKNYADCWQEIKDSTMTTIGKNTGRYPDSDWKLKLLISEHSPIRRLRIKWKWEAIKSWVSVHFVRHKIGIEHQVSTRRTDRTGINRDELRQDELVNHEIDANAQAVINISRKRMCFQASKETREEWFKVVNAIKDVEQELYITCVPECVYRCGCSEVFPCNFFDRFKIEAIRQNIDITNIEERYRFYKKMFGEV